MPFSIHTSSCSPDSLNLKRTPPRNDFDAHITWSRANRQPCLLWQIWGVLMRRKLNFCWRLFNLLYYAIWRLHPSEIPTFMAYFVYYMVLTHFDSKDDYRTGCRNVSHCQQQSYSGLRSLGRSCSTYLWNNSWVQTVHRVWCDKTFFLKILPSISKHVTILWHVTLARLFYVHRNFDSTY